MSADLVYTPREQFLPFHNRQARWASLNTHRRAGKTVSLVNDMLINVLACPKRKPQVAYIGPTYTQAKRVAWQYMKDYAGPYLSRPPQESELKLTLHGDRVLYCLGADNADALRGMYLDGAVMDEYAMFRPSVFSQVIRPALSDRGGWGVFASTPRGKNLFYDVHKLAENTPKEWYALTLKASTSGLISLHELDDLRKQMDDESFAQEYECSFDAALKGAIFAKEVDEMFAEGRFHTTDLPTLYDPNLPTHFAYDLGFTDATVCIAWQEQKGRRVIIKCTATTGQDIFYHIEELHSFSGEVGEVWLPHDARAKNLQTGKSVVEQFLSEGVRPRIVPSHKVRDGISACRKVFPTVVIEEAHTGELIEALKSYRREWNDDLGMFSDRPVHDWASDYADVFRYFALVSQSLDQAAAKTTDESNEFSLENLFTDNEARFSRIQRIA